MPRRRPGTVKFYGLESRGGWPATPPGSARLARWWAALTRIVVIGDLMTDTVAHAMLPLAKSSDTPATVTMHGGGSGANIDFIQVR